MKLTQLILNQISLFNIHDPLSQSQDSKVLLIHRDWVTSWAEKNKARQLKTDTLYLTEGPT